VTGVHPLSTFMRIEAYYMFEYDAVYAHNPGVDLMKFVTCFNVRSVPGVRMHLLDSGSSLFLTPFKDALILGIKTVINITGVGGDVTKIKSQLVYTFLDSKGEYVGFHYQSLYLLESLLIPLFATGPVEQQMWSFLLGPSSPCVITSKGRFKYLYSDAQQQDFIGCPKDSTLFQLWRVERGLLKGYAKCLTTGA
jgi:hypothetical protein